MSLNSIFRVSTIPSISSLSFSFPTRFRHHLHAFYWFLPSPSLSRPFVIWLPPPLSFRFPLHCCLYCLSTFILPLCLTAKNIKLYIVFICKTFSGARTPVRTAGNRRAVVCASGCISQAVLRLHDSSCSIEERPLTVYALFQLLQKRWTPQELSP